MLRKSDSFLNAQVVWKFEVLKNILQRIRFHLPSKLPRGSQEFEDFCDSIIHTYSFPNDTTYRHSIAVMLQHLPPQTTLKPKAWFADSIRNAQTRETAFFKIEEYKKEFKAKDEAEKAAALAASQIAPETEIKPK